MKLNPWFAFPVIAAGIAGALIGHNIAKVACAPIDPGAVCDPGSSAVVLAIGGAVASMIGVGIVIVLVIRSLAEWRQTKSDDD